MRSLAAGDEVVVQLERGLVADRAITILENQMTTDNSTVSSILGSQGRELLNEWVDEQLNAPGVRTDLLSEEDLRARSEQFLDAFDKAVGRGNSTDIAGPGWRAVRDLLTNVSSSRAVQGFTPTETATFVFSLKKPLVARLRIALSGSPEAFDKETWELNELLDRLGLYTTEVSKAAKMSSCANSKSSSSSLRPW